MNPNVRLRVGHQHLQFWPILARFMDYQSPFWGPEAISIVVGPQGALTCRLSTLTVLANSGLFLGQLLSYRGPEMISTIYEPRVVFTCLSAALTILAGCCPFHGC